MTSLTKDDVVYIDKLILNIMQRKNLSFVCRDSEDVELCERYLEILEKVKEEIK